MDEVAQSPVEEENPTGNIAEQMLYRFPVFPLNDSYVRALYDVLLGKVRGLFLRFQDLKEELCRHPLEEPSAVVGDNGTEQAAADLLGTDPEVQLELSESEGEYENDSTKNMPRPVVTTEEVAKPEPLSLTQRLRREDSMRRMLMTLEVAQRRTSASLAKTTLLQMRRWIRAKNEAALKLVDKLARCYRRTMCSTTNSVIRAVKTQRDKERRVVSARLTHVKENVLAVLRGAMVRTRTLVARAVIRRNVELASKVIEAAREILRTHKAETRIGTDLAMRVKKRLRSLYMTVWQIAYRNRALASKQKPMVTFDDTLNKATAADTVGGGTIERQENQENTLLQVLAERPREDLSSSALLQKHITVQCESKAPAIKVVEKTPKRGGKKRQPGMRGEKKTGDKGRRKAKKSILPCLAGAGSSYRGKTVAFIAKTLS